MSTNPQDDADRIRLKRLAKLQGATSSSPSPSLPLGSPGPSTPPISRTPPPTKPKVQPVPVPAKRPVELFAPSPAPQKRPVARPAHLDLPTWEDETIGQILNVTLSKEKAEKSAWDIVWLKHLATELQSESPDVSSPLRLNVEIIDRLLIARLELDPQGMSDDLDYLPVLASLPPQLTVFEYLVGCWKRAVSTRSALDKKAYPPLEKEKAISILDKTRDLIISYTGLTLQEPEMFPQPSGKPLGPLELVTPLISLSTLSAPLLSVASSSQAILSPSDIEPFLKDLARRFEPDNEIDGVLGPVVRELCFHQSLFRPEGLAGGDASWRGVIGGLEALVSVKSIAKMITRHEDFNPPTAQAHTIEAVSLLGPLLRLGVFQREWPSISAAYFIKPKDRPASDMQSAQASLRGTLKNLQSSMFKIFDAFVRAGPEAQEAVLQYFARIVSLNMRRAGTHVEPETVASDSFMVNLQAIMLRLCEPFMDTHYTKIDRIDPLYYARTNRIDLKEETRINATQSEAEEWREQQQAQVKGQPPKFLSEIFYLTLAMNHYGLQKTITSLDELGREHGEITRHLESLQGDGSWQGGPMQARVEQAINAAKAEQEKLEACQLAFQTQLAEPELVFRGITFANFVSTWLIRLVDPRHAHPNTTVELPLPKEVPFAFRILPEYIVEDVVDYHSFTIRYVPESYELSGKIELLTWALTLLTSTWYIKNPFLKSKVVDTLFWASIKYDGRRSVLESMLNSHPMAMKYLMSALIHFYIEVEQTGASSQFYDKFSNRSIASIFRIIWNNPDHRDALKRQARDGMEKFIRFVNLIINDVTYLMDESLTDLAKIHEIQQEMRDTETFSRQPAQHRRERESTLRGLERQTTTYTQLTKSTVALLKMFTAETKEPFMAPEIVDRLAAMLDYNLEALAGPRCGDLKVSNPEKYKFEPKTLLSDIVQVFLNLSEQGEFARAVANDGRSYRKELFENAARIARKAALKSEQDIEKLRLFVVKVEEMKATLEAEDDLGEIPDEFLDPLMYTLMRDPVILPTSRTTLDRATIKSHLLSDAKDPFNRMPLSLEDVIPDLELKARIESFLSERRNKNTVYDRPEGDVVHMDASAD
ncbi:ubiquitin conjugation factor E4 [Cytidiella melzeri]|nr:ubiquitin conjugation factor E4 [Cytidiella melzeri]